MEASYTCPGAKKEKAIKYSFLFRYNCYVGLELEM